MALDLRTTINEIYEFSIEEDLIKAEELGTRMNFEPLRETINKIFSLVKRIDNSRVEEAPDAIARPLREQLLAIKDRFQNLKNFDITHSNIERNRTNLISQVKASYDELIVRAIPVFNFEELFEGNSLNEEANNAKLLIKNLGSLTKEFNKKAASAEKEIQEMVENVKSFATTAGVAKHSEVFKNESILHEGEASKWKSATIWLLVGITIIAMGMTLFGLYQVEEESILQFSISKIVILTTLFYALTITNRNYKAHKHNAVLNKHRQNALTTFETFAEAAGADETTKNAVLLETTHAIFSSQQTGYLKNPGEQESNSKIIEIFKDISSPNS